jgi:hypothetical protein
MQPAALCTYTHTSRIDTRTGIDLIEMELIARAGVMLALSCMHAWCGTTVQLLALNYALQETYVR